MNTHLFRSFALFVVSGAVFVALHAADPPSKDSFGVVKFAPTTKGGREWFADWKTARSVAPYKQDAKDALFKNEYH